MAVRTGPSATLLLLLMLLFILLPMRLLDDVGFSGTFVSGDATNTKKHELES